MQAIRGSDAMLEELLALRRLDRHRRRGCRARCRARARRPERADQRRYNARPEGPIGWPSASAPRLTLTFSSGMPRPRIAPTAKSLVDLEQGRPSLSSCSSRSCRAASSTLRPGRWENPSTRPLRRTADDAVERRSAALLGLASPHHEERRRAVGDRAPNSPSPCRLRGRRRRASPTRRSEHNSTFWLVRKEIVDISAAPKDGAGSALIRAVPARCSLLKAGLHMSIAARRSRLRSENWRGPEKLSAPHWLRSDRVRDTVSTVRPR